MNNVDFSDTLAPLSHEAEGITIHEAERQLLACIGGLGLLPIRREDLIRRIDRYRRVCELTAAEAALSGELPCGE
ncbi:MAG: hypothetical protein J6K32_02220 [Clostridia bacterium]|nr:hypothetical protein [Clostridia bacterium]